MYLSVACTSNNYIYIYNATWLVSNLRYVGSHLKSHISGWNRVWWWSQVIHFLVDSPKSPIFSFATSHYYLVSPHSVIKIYIYTGWSHFFVASIKENPSSKDRIGQAANMPDVKSGEAFWSETSGQSMKMAWRAELVDWFLKPGGLLTFAN